MTARTAAGSAKTRLQGMGSLLYALFGARNSYNHIVLSTLQAYLWGNSRRRARAILGSGGGGVTCKTRRVKMTEIRGYIFHNRRKCSARGFGKLHMQTRYDPSISVR